MKTVVLVSEKQIEVEIDWIRGEVKIGKRTYSFKRGQGILFFKERPFPYECVRDSSGLPTAILFRGKVIPVSFVSRRKENKDKNFKREIHAPLNGQVVRVLVKDRDRVEEGRVILTLEAMKMENEMVAPFPGVIQELRVREGQVVKAGDLLFKMEPLGSR